MSNVYWYKAILSSPAVVNGKKVDGWEHLDGNRGVRVFDSERDAELLTGLTALRSRQVGGVKPISEAEYNDLKKKLPWKTPGPKSWLDETLKVNGKEHKKKPSPPKKVVAPPVADPSQSETDVPQRPNDQPDFRSNPNMFRPQTKKLSSLGLDKI